MAQAFAGGTAGLLSDVAGGRPCRRAGVGSCGDVALKDVHCIQTGFMYDDAKIDKKLRLSKYITFVGLCLIYTSPRRFFRILMQYRAAICGSDATIYYLCRYYTPSY